MAIVYVEVAKDEILEVDGVLAFGSVNKNGRCLMKDNLDEEFDDLRRGLPIVAGEIINDLMFEDIKVLFPCNTLFWYILK